MTIFENDVRPDLVLDLIEAYRRSKTMFAALELGVFDRLPATAVELNAELHCAELERLLDACVALGLLSKEGEVYGNSPAAEKFLTGKSPDTLAGYVKYSNAALYPMWGDLEGAVREGTHRWQGREDLFANFFRTDESMRHFLQGMHGFGQLSSAAVVEAFNLSGFRKLVDLGGATGHLASAAQARYPGLEIAVFDLPRVIEIMRPPGGVAGDFFQDELPQADLYAAGRILHDWADPKCAILLSKIVAALPDGGALLIAEKILDGVPAHMQSLNMLVVTEGRERTLEQYEVLLRQAGFRSVESRITATPLDAILARK